MSVQKENKFLLEKARILSDAVKLGRLTDMQSAFVDLIVADTFPAESATLLKVKAVIELGPILEERGVGKGKMLYVGAGRDWRFPIALGARDVVLMDSGDTREEVKGDILAHDPLAVVEKDSILFTTPFSQKAKITIANADVEKYRPAFPVNSVLEFQGPTKLPQYSFGIVTPAIADQLEEGSIVINFDSPIYQEFWGSKEFFEERGISPLGTVDHRFVQIVDLGKGRRWAKGLIPNPEIVYPGSNTVVRLDDI